MKKSRRQPDEPIDRARLVTWLRSRGRQETDAADHVSRGGALAEAVAIHRTRGDAFLDLAAWIEGRMDLGVAPRVSRSAAAHILAADRDRF